MKVRLKALKRGTRVSPSTMEQVHFDPNAKRFPLARRPFVDERDIDYFVESGLAEKPKPNTRRYGREEEREVIMREGRAPRAEDEAARRVAAASDADAAGGAATSGLSTRQARNWDPAQGVRTELEGDDGEGEGEGEGDDEGDGLGPDDPDAPPAGGREPAAARESGTAGPRRRGRGRKGAAKTT